MQSFHTTEQANPLASALEAIAEIDKRIDEIEQEAKTLKKRRMALEAVAVEEMSSGRIEGVRTAGRSWWCEVEHSLSLSAENRDEVMRLLREEGQLEPLLTIATTQLKGFLKHRAAAAGKDKSRPWSEGTPYEAFVSEYVRPVLRHRASE